MVSFNTDAIRHVIRLPSKEIQSHLTWKIQITVGALFSLIALTLVSNYCLNDIRAVCMTVGAIGIDLVILGSLVWQKKGLFESSNRPVKPAEIYDFICSERDPAERKSLMNLLDPQTFSFFLGWVRKNKDLNSIPDQFFVTAKAYASHELVQRAVIEHLSSRFLNEPPITKLVSESINFQEVMARILSFSQSPLRFNYLQGETGECGRNTQDPIFELLKKIHHSIPPPQ